MLNLGGQETFIIIIIIIINVENSCESSKEQHLFEIEIFVTI